MKIITIASILWLNAIRRKDIYVLFLLLGAILVTLVSLNIFGLGSTTGYVKDIGLLMTWLFSCIMAVIISSRELPLEESSGTILSLLAKPVTRLQLITGKWVGAWSMISFVTALFYLLVAGIVAVKRSSFDEKALIQAFMLHSILLGFICALGIVFSTRMNHDAAAVMTLIVTTVCFLVVPRIPEFMFKETGFHAVLLMLIYNSFPHFEVFDMRQRLVHNYGPAGGGTVLLVAGYGIALITTALWAGWMVYRNKRFVRGKTGE